MSKPYRYLVVTANGSGVHGAEHKTLASALTAAKALYRSKRWLDVEVERVLHLPGGSRRYWMRAGWRWELWNPERDIVVRNPTYAVPVEAA